ncbi:MAG: preprotein translocase YidC, partial [Clostridia bacterium]|nr:preprotein translocase YidC [Clostridia bacterium]
MVLNRLRPPEKEIDWAELEESRKELAAYTNTGKETVRSREDKHREKADYKRFFSVGNKHLVFYSESSGFYKYYERIIAYILANSKLTVHYVTSDPKDQIFDIAQKEPRIVPYYIGQKKLITLFMKLEADVMVMTMSDLGNYQYKRSYYSKDIRYVYVFHYPLSTHMVLHTGALRHYDTILCVGDFQFEEIRQTEKLFGDPEQELIACGYGQLEKLYDAYRETPRTERTRPKVLIAPSWQADNILDSCIDDLLKELLGEGFDVTVRPHPEYVKRYGDRMDAIVKRYEDYTGGDLFFELDFTGNTSIFDSDTVISDWSGTAYEFVMVTERPCVFIDTPPKINNPDYEKITVAPLEFTLRDQVGIRVKPGEFSGLAERIRGLLEDGSFSGRIREIREKTIANFGRSGEVGGRYIIDAVKEKVKNRTKQ